MKPEMPVIRTVGLSIAGDGQIVREAELTVLVAEATEPVEYVPVGIRDRHTAPVGRCLGLVTAVRHERATTRRRIDGIGSPQLRRLPLRQESPRLVEYLDAGIGTIGNEHAPSCIDRDAVRQVELTGTGPRRAPGLQQSPIRCELEHPGVAVAVADEKRAVVGHDDVRRQVEMPLVVSGHASFAEREQQTPVWRELENLVAADIGEPDVVVTVDRDAMRHDEESRAPRLETAARDGVKDPHRRMRNRIGRKRFGPGAPGAMEHPDAALRVDVDAGRLPQNLARRQLGPAVHHRVALNVRGRFRSVGANRKQRCKEHCRKARLQHGRRSSSPNGNGASHAGDPTPPGAGRPGSRPRS
jgi:hypothetical protein